MLMLAVAAISAPTLASAQSGADDPSSSAETGDDNAPTSLSAEQISGRPDREIILEREAEVTRGEVTLNADKVTYDIIEDEVEATGAVRLKRAGDRFTGDDLKLKLDTGIGYVTNPTYRLELNNGQGKADRIDFEGQDRARVSAGTYSTCEGPDPDWYIESSTINLDYGRDTGNASKAIVYFKDVPILGTPYMSFPLSDARKSGVLPPTFGTSSKGGFELTVPYYFNIAPNRDLTVYPKAMSKRGVQLGAQGRYLGETYSGDTRLEFLPGDRVTGEDRYAISSTHAQRFGAGWSFASNLNAASDDDYPNDFSSTLTTASQRLLLRDMHLTYAESFWSTTLRASNYQVLQDPKAPIGRPYDRLPQLTFRAAQQNINGFDWSAISELTAFSHPTRLKGERLVVNPKISYPILHPSYFVIPKLSLHATTYSVDADAPGASSFSRVLPTMSVDSGLVFERETSFLGREAVQTLEPRLFYVYTPYENQEAFPIFDTGLADFNFTQIFSENRFTGHDRISDANQVTAALVSRYIEMSGVERMRFALAQRYYFGDQRVVDRGRDAKSDLLLAASGQVSSTLAVDVAMQYSSTDKTLTRANYGVRWQPAPKKVLNVQYRRDFSPTLVDKLELADVSGQWPLADRWYGVARVNYSLREKRVAETLFGLEYKADCWVFRTVAARTPTATGVSSTSIFFQLELNGFSRIGSDPLPALRNNVPGYQLVNQPDPTDVVMNR